MTVTRSDVEHIARLAALAVDEKSLPELTRQIGQILQHISQLEGVQGDPGSETIQPVHQSRLRADEPRKAALSRPLNDIAPQFADGLFLVPRLDAMDDE